MNQSCRFNELFYDFEEISSFDLQIIFFSFKHYHTAICYYMTIPENHSGFLLQNILGIYLTKYFFKNEIVVIGLVFGKIYDFHHLSN